MPEKLLLKDMLFHRANVAGLAADLGRVLPSFAQDEYTQTVVKRFPELELKARIGWMAECLRVYLPDNYRRAVGVILRALPPPNDPSLTDDDFGDFIHAPFNEFVARYGCNAQDLAFSLNALREITMRFSAEDALRYFINAFPEHTLATLNVWSTDPNYHVRRLCSEGTRPKLPWSQKLVIPATAAVPILDRLFADPTRYVTRSVANHLNDITKIDAALAVDCLHRWQASGRQRPAEMTFIVAHATRTLIKQGDARAMALIGASADPDVAVARLSVPKHVKMNTALEFSFELTAQQPAEVVVDYAITFLRKSGTTGRKVFKLKRCELAAGERVTLSKRHLLREDMSTRKLFRGRHQIELLINGRVFGTRRFELV
jgi:3-methyladenine DNA glycosylase AlkC